jgi:hypothetical protein
MPIVIADPSMRAHFWLWDSISHWITDYGAGPTSPQIAPMGAAFDAAAGRLIAFYTSTLSETVAVKKPEVAYRTSTVLTTVHSSQYASRQGITGTWDPKTSRFIHAWRGEDNEILLANSSDGVAGAASTPVALTGDLNAASFAPSLSCSDAASMTYNCILLWASAPKRVAGDNYHVIKLTQFRLNYSGGSYIFDAPNPIYAVGYVQFGPPSVVYTGDPAGSSTFVVAWKVPGKCFFTLHKNASPTSQFTGEIGHCVSSGNLGPPTLGTSNGKVEAWAPYDR